jgi:hypothetical protein
MAPRISNRDILAPQGRVEHRTLQSVLTLVYLALLSAAVLLSLLPSTAAAASINRCETSDGRVVYSDEPCPSGTKQARTVNDKPPVEVIPSKDDSARDAKSAGSLRRAPAEPPAPGDPGREKEAASDLRKMRLAECDDLVRRIEYAQRDLNAAAEGERASAELSVRRLQAEHEGKCMRPK